MTNEKDKCPFCGMQRKDASSTLYDCDTMIAEGITIGRGIICYRRQIAALEAELKSWRVHGQKIEAENADLKRRLEAIKDKADWCARLTEGGSCDELALSVLFATTYEQTR